MDHHIHTHLSPDASKDATFERYAEVGLLKGLEGLTFTEHVDFDCPTPLFHSIPDFIAYKRRLDEAQQTTKMPLYMGVELGYQPHVREAMCQLVASHPFSCINLSVHYVHGLDPYQGTIFEGRSQQDAIALYFEAVYDAITSGVPFDTLAHLDYILRYGPFTTRTIDMDRHQPILDQILKTLIAMDAALEVNTGSYRYFPGTHPLEPVLTRYRALGGTRVTLASDAHRTEEVGRNFPVAMALLKACGFSEITTIVHRKKTQKPL